MPPPDSTVWFSNDRCSFRSQESGQSIQGFYKACSPSPGWAGSHVYPKTGLCPFGRGLLGFCLPPSSLGLGTWIAPHLQPMQGATVSPEPPPLPPCGVTHCLSQRSPHLKVVLPSPGLRGLISWLLFFGWWGVIPRVCPSSFLILFSVDFLRQRKHFSLTCSKMLPLFCSISMRHERDVSAPYCQAFLLGGAPLFL